MAGKGSTRRPRFVPLSELAARWDATFGTPPAVQSDDDLVIAPRFTPWTVEDFNVTSRHIDAMPFNDLPTPSPAPDVEA